MRLYLITFLLITAGLFAESSEKSIASDAITLSSKLLSKNVEDKDGLAFYNLAKALTPDSDMVMLMGGYMKKGLTPKALPGSKSKDDLLKEIKARGIYLTKSRFKKNREVGNIALLLLRFVDSMDPKDEDVLYAEAYLNTYGYTDSLDALYDETYELDAPSKSGKKPHKSVNVELNKYDQMVADYSIKLGQKLLAADSTSKAGLKWARLGHHLNPSDHQGLYTLKAVVKGVPVKPSNTSITPDTLISKIVERAEYYVKKAEKDDLAAHLAQLYFKVADAIKPNQREVLIGLMRLEQMDKKSSLDDLFDTDIASLAGVDADDDDDNRGTHTRVEAVAKKELDGSKLRPKAKSLRKNLERDSDYYYYDLEERTLYGKLDNYTGQDVDNLVFESYIIGSDARKNEFFVAAKGVYSSVSINKRMWYDIPKLRAYFHKKGKYRYYTYLFIIKDSSGKILNTESNKSTIEKIAKKISTYSAAAYSSSSYYYYSGTRFDKNGSILQHSSLYY